MTFAELRHLSANCKFGDYLPQVIRDCIICGLRSEGTQKCFLAEAQLRLTKALESGQSMEEETATLSVSNKKVTVMSCSSQ